MSKYLTNLSFLLAIFTSGIYCQQWTLNVTGEIPTEQIFTHIDFAKFPRSTVSGNNHDGNLHQFQGVALFRLLEASKVLMGDSLRGRHLLLYLQAEAHDGYKVLYTLAEIDTSFTDRLILVADRKDGKPLDNHEGPLQIIVPGEKKHARWIRQLRTLRVIRGKI